MTGKLHRFIIDDYPDNVDDVERVCSSLENVFNYRIVTYALKSLFYAVINHHLWRIFTRMGTVAELCNAVGNWCYSSICRESVRARFNRLLFDSRILWFDEDLFCIVGE